MGALLVSAVFSSAVIADRAGEPRAPEALVALHDR
jgi:hypothetical protein